MLLKLRKLNFIKLFLEALLNYFLRILRVDLQYFGQTLISFVVFETLNL